MTRHKSLANWLILTFLLSLGAGCDVPQETHSDLPTPWFEDVAAESGIDFTIRALQKPICSKNLFQNPNQIVRNFIC